jgi:nicotinic acid mononucleotide adenylyltransferase
MCEIVSQNHRDWLGVSSVCKDMKDTPVGQLQSMKRIIERLQASNPHTKFHLVAGQDFVDKMSKAASLLVALSTMAKTTKKIMPISPELYTHMVNRLARASEIIAGTPIVACERTKGVSSTMLRESLQAGQRPDFIPEELYRVIRKEKLYQGPAP